MSDTGRIFRKPSDKADRASDIDIENIRAAARRIEPYAVITPLLESPVLNDRVGGRVLLKAEVLQRTGSFKLRGALNRIAQLSRAELARGVVAYSSGNHAQAVSLAARLFGSTAVIVMPADAPKVKIDKTRFYGGEVIFYDRYTEDRAAVGAKIAEDRNLVLVPPYDDPEVTAGQGTLGLEMASQAASMGAELDALLVCCSGGGLTAGCALAMEAESPATAVYSAEPAGFDDTLRSLATGHRVSNDPGSTSICDAILIDKPGELTFPINKRLLTGGVVVNDNDALKAMALAYEEFKIVVEPGGAVALAAVISGQVDCRGKTVGVVCSGGNVSTDVFRSALDLAHAEMRVA